MLQQIFSHTPLYVWAILGFLVYRGVLASRTREVTLRKLFIVPLVWRALDLPSLSQTAVTVAAVMAVPALSGDAAANQQKIVERSMHRLLGCGLVGHTGSPRG